MDKTMMLQLREWEHPTEVTWVEDFHCMGCGHKGIWCDRDGGGGDGYYCLECNTRFDLDYGGEPCELELTET